MSTGPVSNLSSGYVQSVLSSVLENTGALNNRNSSGASGLNAVSSLMPPDHGEISPLAQMMSKLQDLQQSDPAKYRQVTQQIATNLQAAAQTAQSSGNSSAAAQLNQLASDFTSASQSGQLPNLHDLAKAIVGHHHHQHHSHATAATEDATAPASSTASNGSAASGNRGLPSQFLSYLQSSGAQSDALNPLSIINDTIWKAGI